MRKLTTSILVSAVCGLICGALPMEVLAQFYNGPGIVGGISHAEAVGGITGFSIRDVILNVLLAVLAFMGLAAVVVIVIAGITLVLSIGDDGAREKARKIILYAVLGLVVIVLAAAIVLLIINATGGASIFGPVPDLGATGGTDIRETVLGVLDGILQFMALIAVVVIVIAGILLVVSFGEEQSKDRAKRIILYAVIGLVIILLASAIVGIISEASQ